MGMLSFLCKLGIHHWEFYPCKRESPYRVCSICRRTEYWDREKEIYVPPPEV